MKIRNLAVLALAAALAPAPLAGDAVDPKRVVLQMVEAINGRDLEAFGAVVADDVVRHSAATPGVVVENLEQFKAFLQADFASVPDSTITVNLIFAAEDHVALHATYEGTQTGPMGPFPASGRNASLPYLSILRVEQGKVAELWVEWDNLSLLSQLGHLPLPSRDNGD